MIETSNGAAAKLPPPQLADVHAEYVFSVNDMKKLLRSAGNDDIIAVRVRFEADKRAGRRRVFRARITAELESLSGKQSDENGAPVMQALNYRPSARSIEGCPNPPSCSL